MNKEKMVGYIMILIGILFIAASMHPNASEIANFGDGAEYYPVYQVGDNASTSEHYSTYFNRTVSGEIVGIKGELLIINSSAGHIMINRCWIEPPKGDE